VIDESEEQFRKQDEPRISISARMWTLDEFEKLRINLRWILSIRKSRSMTNVSLPISIEIEDNMVGIMIDESDDS
jgi:hypothetical protein